MASVSEFIREIDTVRKGNLALVHRNFLKQFIKQHRELYIKLKLDTSIADENSPGRYRILDTIAAIFYHQTLFNALMLYLAEPVRHVYQSLIWEGRQRIETLEKRFSVPIASEKDNIQDPQEAVLPQYLMLTIYSHNYYDFHQGKYIYSDFELGLTTAVRNHLRKIAEPPAEAQLKPITDLPTVEFVYENTPVFFDEFMAVRTYLEQHEGERISTGVVNKVRKYFNMREFYPETIKPLAGLRTKLLLQFTESCSPRQKKTIEAHQQVKEIFKVYSSGHFSNLQYLLTHLKGSKGRIDENTTVNSILLDTLTGLPLMQWISLPNLLTHIRYVKPEIMPFREYIARTAMHIETQGKFGKEPLKIRDDLYFLLITEPLLKSTFFLFAAFGLVDIAYTQPRNEAAQPFGLDYISVYDGLAYVRLTPFGAFVCGMYSTYQPPADSHKKAEFILDDGRLIITLSEEDKLKNLLLEKYATQTTENRYRVDYESFLKDCETKRQILKKIENFRKEIKPDPPQIWEDFFKSIVARYSSIQPKKDFRIYKLPSGDKELLGLVAKDEILRTIVYKAENYHIMVNELDMPLFQERLKKFGYLWE